MNCWLSEPWSVRPGIDETKCEDTKMGKRGGPVKWTKGRIEAAFAAFVDANGRLPVARELNPQNNLPTRKTFETKMGVSAQEYAARRYPELLAARDERQTDHIRQYRSERQEWSVDRLIQAEQAFFQAWGRLPTAREYTAENGLPMYSVFCALTREAFEARLEMLFQEVPAQIEEDQEPDESDSMSEMSFHF